MFLDSAAGLTINYIFPILLSSLAAWLLSLRFGHGLHQFPGPFLASFTNLWRVWHALVTSGDEPMVKLHQEYGDIVRLGPTALSFGHPKAIRDIYGPQGLTQKVFAIPGNNHIILDCLSAGNNMPREIREICTVSLLQLPEEL